MNKSTIRDYCDDVDSGELRECLIELQDFERSLDNRMPTGESIVDEYVSQLLENCEKYSGKIIVTEANSIIAGFVSIWTRTDSDYLDEKGMEYAYVSDLFVREQFRGAGLGRCLLEAAESHARESGAEWLRIGVLTENQPAYRLYRAAGFAERSAELEKSLATE